MGREGIIMALLGVLVGRPFFVLPLKIEVDRMRSFGEMPSWHSSMGVIGDRFFVLHIS